MIHLASSTIGEYRVRTENPLHSGHHSCMSLIEVERLWAVPSSSRTYAKSSRIEICRTPKTQKMLCRNLPSLLLDNSCPAKSICALSVMRDEKARRKRCPFLQRNQFNAIPDQNFNLLVWVEWKRALNCDVERSTLLSTPRGPLPHVEVEKSVKL